MRLFALWRSRFSWKRKLSSRLMASFHRDNGQRQLSRTNVVDEGVTNRRPQEKINFHLGTVLLNHQWNPMGSDITAILTVLYTRLPAGPRIEFMHLFCSLFQKMSETRKKSFPTTIFFLSVFVCITIPTITQKVKVVESSFSMFIFRADEIFCGAGFKNFAGPEYTFKSYA